MGAGFSIKTPQYIIGDIRNMPPEEQKLYSLSKHVFVKDETSVQEVSRRFGPNILGLKYEDHQRVENKACCVDNDDESFNRNDNNVVSESSVSVCVTSLLGEGMKKRDESLFRLLVTEKPFWYSQSFCLWKRYYDYETCFSCCQTVQETIYIQPVDNFPSFIRDFEIKLKSFREHFDFFTLLRTFAEAFFDGMNVRILPEVQLLGDRWNIKSRVHQKTGQKQLLVSDFYPRLNGVKPRDGYCIMGITWTDLYPTEDLNFVLGEANNSFKSGVFCFGRFEPKTYDPDTHVDISGIDGQLLWRILKVFSHELCHLFGIQHCWYFACSMNESNSMAEAFSQPLFLCPVCLRKLQFVCQFSLVARYRKLLRVLRDLSELYPTRHFKDAVQWLEKCLVFLQHDRL